jgi:hypothetical protein
MQVLRSSEKFKKFKFQGIQNGGQASPSLDVSIEPFQKIRRAYQNLLVSVLL